MNNIFCINCGKYNHNSKTCTNPITSCGIICFNVNNIKIKHVEKNLINKFIDIEDYNYKNLKYLNKTEKFKNNIKFLLIQRKHSISFIEFIRGIYDEKNNDKIKILFELMSKDEIEQIKINDFDYLWNKVWLKTANNKIYQREFNSSKIKFNNIKLNNIIDNFESKYDTPEWGFPKGRRNKYENNIKCACREFIEETSVFSSINNKASTLTNPSTISSNKLSIISSNDSSNVSSNNPSPVSSNKNSLNNKQFHESDYDSSIKNNNYVFFFNRISSIEETFYGTNNIQYKHIYYLAGTDDITTYINKDNLESTFEVSDIGWFTIDEAINLIRPYSYTKINIINQVYFFLSTVCDKISSSYIKKQNKQNKQNNIILNL